MTLDFLPSSYPANDATDGQYLYRSLGSFWTQVFQDKNVLKGYTAGMAEELIQTYYNLAETIRQYAVKDIDVLHTEKWKPLTIKKSEYNKTSFLFEADGTVFGFQPASNTFYANQLFRFGYPKETDGRNIFSFTPDFSLKKFGAISNRLISPSLLLLPGVDVVSKNNSLYFNTDLFNNPYIPKAKVLSDYGAVTTYKDAEGNVHDDEFIVLWIYHAELDNEELYKNFGVLFDIRLPSSKNYKELLKAIVNLSVEGPTITALNSAFAALANTPTIIEPREVVEDLYDDENYKYIITDKNAYRFPAIQEINDTISIGQILYAGDVLSYNVRLIDSVIDPVWWKREFVTNKLGLSSHVFAANTKNQLLFKNSIELITYSGKYVQWRHTKGNTDWVNLISLPDLDGTNLREIEVRNNGVYLQWRRPGDKFWLNIVRLSELPSPPAGEAFEVRVDYVLNFPVMGRPEDVLEFQKYINRPENKDQLLEKLNFQPNKMGSLAINPVDFVFSNIFKNNTLLLKLNFYSEQELNNFFDLLPMLQNYMPAHVYIITYLDFQLVEDDLTGLNSSLRIDAFGDRKFSMDGSAMITGTRPELFPSDPEYYKDYLNRLFCVSVGPYREYSETEDPQPLHNDNNLDLLEINNSAIKNDGGTGIKCGLLRTDIPLQVILPGELAPRIPSTREFPSILLIDF